MATPLNSAVKKKKGPSITRQDLLKKSPIPWAVLLGITAIGAGLMVWPNASDWMQKQKDIETMVKNLPALEAKKQQLSNQKEELESEFSEKSSEFVKIADQRFPETIDVTKLAQILEIYSILVKSNYQPIKTLELASISTSPARNVDGANYAQTPVSLNLVADRETFKEFLIFLRSSQIPDELRNLVISSGGGDTASLEFLNANRLPVSRIETLSMNEERGRDEGGGTNSTYNTQLQLFFYSQPL